MNTDPVFSQIKQNVRLRYTSYFAIIRGYLTYGFGNEMILLIVLVHEHMNYHDISNGN